jgi:hypothetical protein
MYQESGLAWLERQAEVAEDLLAERKRQKSATADGLWPDDGPLPCKTSTAVSRPAAMG